ncbi:MAG: lyase family protein [Blautia sp.]|nr:lyase family protein [Blautia sp.]
MEQKGGFWTEEDALGSVQIPEDALYGINTVRAMNNFHLEKKVYHAIVQACDEVLAVNLMKIANDLRLMNSGPDGGLGEIRLEALQQGSSIMPGKVIPVITEMVMQVAMRVCANDTAITMAAAHGEFELNAFATGYISNLGYDYVSKIVSRYEPKEAKRILERKSNEDKETAGR